jgi:putative ABC transport system permease protein
MLGIIFGVGAVVAMQSIGAGAKRELLDAIKLLGTNNIIVRTVDLKNEELENAVTKNPKQLNSGDVEALRSILSNVNFIVPVRRDESYIRLPVQEKVEVIGTTPEYQNLQVLLPVEGRFLMETDNREKFPVAVLSEPLKRKLFPLEPATGKRIKVNKTWFTIVGVVSRPESNGEIRGIDVGNSDNYIYVPLNAVQARFPHASGSSPLQVIVIQVDQEKMVRPVAAAIKRIIERRHRNAGDAEVFVPIELLKQSQKTQGIFNIVMGAIASISLFVGGIGIMNIMLSNVLERTREIGIRRAVGATRSHVTIQFLFEATLLSVMGGVIGIILGIVLAWVITAYAGWTTVVGIEAILLAFGVSASVGIIFGLWPAKKAAEMDVINALRYE